MWFDKQVKSNSIVKRYNSMEGSIPHFYHFLSRVFRPASQHTPNYLKKYYGWDELDDILKAAIKRLLEQSDPEITASTWSIKRLGVKVKWDGLEPTLDEVYYTEWRNSKKGKQSIFDWQDTYKQDMIYSGMKTILGRHVSPYEKQWYIR